MKKRELEAHIYSINNRVAVLESLMEGPRTMGSAEIIKGTLTKEPEGEIVVRVGDDRNCSLVWHGDYLDINELDERGDIVSWIDCSTDAIPDLIAALQRIWDGRDAAV